MHFKTKEITLISLFTALIIICSMISIPFGTIPITLQTLAIWMIGLCLTPRQAALSTFLYMILGLLGLPIFAGGSGGIGSIFRPSFGFVIGFIATSWLVATLLNISRKKTWLSLLGATFIGSILLYAIGLSYMAFILNQVMHKGLSFSTILNIGMIPFLPGDLLKIIIAVSLAHSSIIKHYFHTHE